MDPHSRKCDLNHDRPRRIIKAWRTPIEKVDPADADYQWLHDIADASIPDIRQAFLDAVARIRGTIRETELRDALETGNIDRVMQVLGLDQVIADTLRPALLDPLQSTIMEAGAAAPDATIAPNLPSGSISMRFDIVNPNTVYAARNYGFDLIRQVTDDTRAGIRQIVADAMEFGGHPYEQARQIRQLIGLTESQAEAVANFRRLLESGDIEALNRARRDKRYDGTLRRALGEDAELELTPDQIDSMVTRYAEKTLKARAETIARTETLRASNIGARQAQLQAQHQGLLSATATRRFLVTPDDRTCAFCIATELMNINGVGLNEPFQTPLGEFYDAPIHVLCRCVSLLTSF